MSQVAIGKAALVLSVNGAGLRSGLTTAGKDTRKWADDTAKDVGNRFNAIPVGIAAATGIAVGVVKQMNDTLADVAAGGAAAKAFGLTAEQFTGMAGLAASVGEGQREFIESLVTLGKVASEGAAGKGEVATAWFQNLNLNAQEFKALRLDEQFFKVFEAVGQLETRGERVRALMTAFGEDGGKYLLPLLSRTPDELRKMAAGFQVSTEAVEKATAANRAYQQASSTLTAVWRDFAVSASPAIEQLANQVKEFAQGWRAAADAMERAKNNTPGPPGTPPGRDTDPNNPGVIGGWWGRQRERFSLWNHLPTREEFLPHLPSAAEVAPGFVTAMKMQQDAWSEMLGLDDTGRAQRFLDAVNTPPPLPPVEPGALNPLFKQVMELRRAGDAGRKLESALDTLTAVPFVTALAEAAKNVAGLRDQWTVVPGGAGPWREIGEQIAQSVSAENAALLRGSTAEVNARLSHDFRGKDGADRIVDQQKRANELLKNVIDSVNEVADKLRMGPGLLPL